MPGRKGYDLSFAARGSKPQQKREEEVQPSSSSNVDAQEQPLSSSPIHPTQGLQQAPSYPNPGHNKSEDSRIDPSPTSPNTPKATSSTSANNSFLSPNAIYDRPSMYKGVGNTTQRAMKRVATSQTPHAGQRMSGLAPVGAENVSQVRQRQLPGSTHPGAMLSPGGGAGGVAESGMDAVSTSLDVPILIVTSPSDDEDENAGNSR